MSGNKRLSFIVPRKKHVMTVYYQDGKRKQVQITSLRARSKRTKASVDQYDRRQEIETTDEFIEDHNDDESNVVHGQQTNYKSKKVEEAWAAALPAFYEQIIQLEAVNGKQCCRCSKSAYARCIECCYAMMCEDHAKEHADSSFHYVEMWSQDKGYFVELLKDEHILHLSAAPQRNHCSCSFQEYQFDVVSLTCIRRASLQTCACVSLPCAMIELGLFPGSPERPQVAFTFGLLDALEALGNVSSLSVHQFVNALTYMDRSTQSRPCIKRQLFSASSNYRFLQSQARLASDSTTLPVRTDCVQCDPKRSPMRIAIDGNFKLARLQSAGRSYLCEPRWKDNFFVHGCKVQDFIEKNPGCKPRGQCRHRAGQVESLTKLRGLDCTGVLGAVCSHGVPLRILDLKHGERFCYVDCLLKEVFDAYQPKDVRLAYDVACSYKAHFLRTFESDSATKDTVSAFCIPAFHAYGHQASCQAEYGPRNISGFGLSEMEGGERLWANLRELVAQTKNMRPLERIDRISERMEFIARKTNANSTSELCRLLRLAYSRLKEWEEELHCLRREVPDGFDLLSDLTLMNLLRQRNRNNASELEDLASLQPLRLALEGLRDAALERRFHQQLLNAGDNDYAQVKKITGQINRASRILHERRKAYNLLVTTSADSSTWNMPTITAEGAKDPNHPIFDGLVDTSSLNGRCSIWVAMRAVRLFSLVARANEEINYIVESMDNTLRNYKVQYDSLNEISKETLSPARKALIAKRLSELGTLIANAEVNFRQFSDRSDLTLLSFTRLDARQSYDLRIMTSDSSHLMSIPKLSLPGWYGVCQSESKTSRKENFDTSNPQKTVSTTSEFNEEEESDSDSRSETVPDLPIDVADAEDADLPDLFASYD